MPNTFRFSLRELFVVTAFVGLGLLALMYPSRLADEILGLGTSILYTFAIAAAFLTSGSRRKFWATFAIFAVGLMWFLRDGTGTDLIDGLWKILHPSENYADPWTSYPQTVTQIHQIKFQKIAWRLCVLSISTIAAHTLPWLVHRDQNSQQE